MKAISRAVLGVAFGLAAAGASAAPVLMSAEWAKQACAAWNQDPVLTEKLVESEWVGNDKKRGYKVMHVYRTDCTPAKPVEMRIALKDGKAMCVYAGEIENAALDGDVDYLMHADTARWLEMGNGEYGPMRAMMFGRLQFEGPKLEAMRNMPPFENCLLLVGKVSSESTSCPK
ncbi:MAG: sterol-binding protein [Rhodocyclales bacterium CG_4_10_14_3_um_filter_68_10]|nr:MAG: sterol-binding protein [Rhodocyclales bacterium CG_4_10_14_3_um_filter_68_10]